MDERTPNGFDSNKPNSGTPSGFDTFYRPANNKPGTFKVNINNFDDYPTDDTQVYRPQQRPTKPQNTAQPKSAQPQNTVQQKPVQPQRPAVQPRPAQQPKKFNVTIPDESAAKRSTQRSASTRPQQRSGASSQKKASGAKNRSASARSNGTSAKRPTAEQIKKNRARRKYNFTKGMLTACVCLVIIFACTAVLSSLALSTINDILAINKEESQSVSVVVTEDATDFEDIYKTLCDSGLIKQKVLCKLFCKFRHYDEYYSSSEGKNIRVQYEPGVYYLETGSGIEVMLETLKASSSATKDVVRLTFPEGWTIAQIFEKIEKYQVCTAEKLYANLDVAGKQFEFYENIPATTGRYLKAEGYLFPDTYEFYIGENASSVLKKLFSNFDKKWDSDCEKRAEELGMSMDQIINIASIIQREAKDNSQMADISSVIHNRLADPATYPLLEMNSTKDYITATKAYGVFNDAYYSIYLDSYNTYSAQGLPPGAICNPGNDAIHAALYPNDTDYHFFCHDENGNIYLAVTASEHLANTQKLLLYN